METANIIVALGGNMGESVPLYDATPSEVAVLRAIHGDQAVYDINITGTVARTHRQEIGRLTQKYGRQDGERRIAPEVSVLFPGAAARAFEAFEELELPESLFVATGRKVATPVDPLDHDGDGKKGGSRPAPAADTSLSGMTVKDLQALADAEDVDLTGVSRKADIIEAIELNRASKQADVEPDEDDDGVGAMNDDFADSEGDILG